MALPVTITGVSSGSVPVGPFKSSAGNYYFFGRSSAGTQVTVVKATDPTSSFSNPTTNPTAAAGSINEIDALQDGDTIHLVHGTVSAGGLFYTTFDMSTDTWSGTWTTIGTTSSAGGGQTRPRIVRRSNGDLVVFFIGSSEVIMGGTYYRAHYSRRTSGTWTTTVAVAAPAGVATQYIPYGAALGASDAVHMFYTDGTGLTQSTLDSSNTLQTASTAASFSGTLPQNYNGRAFSYASGGSTYVICAANDNGTVKSYYFTSANTPTISVATIASSALANPGPSIMRDGTTVYVGYGLAADSDYYIRSSTDNGASWSAATNIATTTLNNSATNNLPITAPASYTRGGNYVYAFCYYNGTNYIYDEYVLRAAATFKYNQAIIIG